MTLLLKRNSTPDPWYTVHKGFIEEGDIVSLNNIINESERSAEYPPEILVSRGILSDPYIYKASLCCFDYVGSCK